MNTNLGNIVLAMSAPLVWGSCFASNKMGLDYFTPTWQVFFLVLSSFVVFTLFAPFFLRRVKIWKFALYAGSLGILEPGLTYYFGQAGMVTTDAGISAILISTESIVTVLLLSLFGLERPGRTFMLLALMSFIGVAVTIGVGPESMLYVNLTGVALIFLAVLCASAYAILGALLIRDEDPIVVVYFQQIVTLVLLGSILFATGESMSITPGQDIPMAQWVNIVVTGVAQFGIAFSLFNAALKRVKTSIVSVCLTLMPLAGLISGYVVLGERLTLMQGLGAIITLSGLIMISARQINREETAREA